MADDHTVPPDQDPGSEISDHVNDYLAGLRARFDELTDRIEEASRASIDRGRAELEETLASADGEMPNDDPDTATVSDVVPANVPVAAASQIDDTTPGARQEPPHGADGDVPTGSERLAARLRELEAAEAAAGAGTPPEVAGDAAGMATPAPPADAGVAMADPESEPATVAAFAMPRAVNTSRPGSRRWVVGTLVLLILLSGAFVAGRWWSSPDDPTATPTTLGPPATSAPDAPGDEAIQGAVDGAVASIAPTGVTTKVTDGVVVLTGAVDSSETRAALSTVVADIVGVRQIDNRVDIATVEPPTPEAIQAEADAARIDTGFEHLNVTVQDGVATVTGVVSVDSVTNGVFGSIAPLADALSTIDGIDGIVTRVQLRGDEAALRADLKALISDTPIIFASGSPDLDVTSSATLDRAAEIIMSYPGLRVLIAGHTDAAGGTAQNEALATARGQVVLGYLISRGVPVTRLQVVSYGELFPEGGSDQSLNRRIEFEVAP